MGPSHQWWKRPDHYRWLSGYLEYRNPAQLHPEDDGPNPLTGLHNRRGFHHSLQSLISASPGRGGPYLAVAMVDLDRFKQVNDTRVHATGDRLLVAVGASLRQATSERAVVARVGGEEFLIAEVTRSDGADAMAERIRLAVASTAGDVTASVGVACGALDGSDITSRAIVGELVEAADTAMYEAKRSGGNQSRRAQPVSEPDPPRQ